MQRRDDLSVFAQLFVRVTVGWHPAIWWLLRQLHAEREAACDQLAVSITGSAKAYAGCLAKLATLRVDAVPAASGRRHDRRYGAARSRRADPVAASRAVQLASRRAGRGQRRAVRRRLRYWRRHDDRGRDRRRRGRAHRDLRVERGPGRSHRAAVPTSQPAETPGGSIDLPVAPQARFGAVSLDPVTPESPFESGRAAHTGRHGAPHRETPLPVVAVDVFGSTRLPAAVSCSGAFAPAGRRSVSDRTCPANPPRFGAPPPRAAPRSAADPRKRRSRRPGSSPVSAGSSLARSERSFRVRIHLVNPSDLSFGTAVITPRWLYRAGRGHARALRHAASSSTRRSSRSIWRACSRATSSGSASTRRTRCAATSWDATRARRGAYVVFGGIHSTLYPDEVREHGAAHAVVSGDGDLVWPNVLADCEAGSHRSPATTAAASRATRSRRRGGICCRPIATCGARCRPCAAARSTARSARCGAPTARSRDSAASTTSSARSSSCGARGSASSCWPTTTSTRSRSPISRRPIGAPTSASWRISRRCARSGSS